MNISSIITNKFIKEEKTRAPLYTWRLHARPTLQQNYKTLFIIKNVTEDEENYKTLKKERVEERIDSKSQGHKTKTPVGRGTHKSTCPGCMATYP